MCAIAWSREPMGLGVNPMSTILVMGSLGVWGDPESLQPSFLASKMGL